MPVRPLLIRLAALVCLGLGLAAAPARAQLTDASLKGLVRSGGGTPVAGGTITVTLTATGQSRTTVTTAEGTFLLQGLIPGDYLLLVEATGFQPVGQADLRLASGATVDVTVDLPDIALTERVEVSASRVTVAASRDPRLTESFDRTAIQNLPLPQRDIFMLPALSAGAALVPGAANSTKLTSSPVVTVNGNRYRGNNYVLDGAMNTNPNNSGEPAIVPTAEAVEEIQVQTLNFAAEFGRGNGSVINVQVRGGSNTTSGRLWEFHRNDALNARNYFASITPQQTFNQFGATIGGPLRRNRTFFFGAYEGTRNQVERPYAFQVETPELRAYVERIAPGSVAARLFRQFAAPTPDRSGATYLDQRTITTPEGVIPAIGRANVTVADDVRFDQYIARVDHTLSARDRLAVRVIAERQNDEGGTSSAPATIGRALRGSRGPFDGWFGNLNVGYTSVFGRAVHDTRVAYQLTDVSRGNPAAIVPTITITGITAPFGDVFVDASRLSTLELRDILTLDRGRHAVRMGVEVRRITKALAVGPPQAGAFTFNSIGDFIADRPFRQTLTVQPDTGLPTNFPRYFTQYETGAFIQDQWTLSRHVSLSLGLRHDYFGTVSERDGRLSSVVLGEGTTFEEQLRHAAIARVDRLYEPQRLNFSPRVGMAWDPSGDGRTSVRTGYSLAYQPHHGQSISGGRALPPDAVQGVIQPSNGIGTAILYDIPVPTNPEFGRGLNAQGGVQSRPGEPPIRTTGFVVNPTIKTQYTQSWFLNGQRRLGQTWRLEVGYVGTRGVNLERIDDVNRFAGDLLDGREDRINPNFGVLLFVTNGVSSSYHAFTSEIRREFVGGLSFSANYRWSKWLDTSSDTSTGQFQDNSEPGKGAQDVSCLRCEKSPSLFDVPHRVAATLVWAPPVFRDRHDVVGLALRHWQVATVFSAQSGRPFSIWNGAAFAAGGDYNADGGGGAVGGGFYDRPDAPADGTLATTFSQEDLLDGLFAASAFPKPAPGRNGTLGRNTFRGPRYLSLDASITRSFAVGGRRQLQVRVDVFNALDTLNLFLPNADLSLSNFGKSTQAFDPRTVQVGARLIF
jgi:hypothetical protein